MSNKALDLPLPVLQVTVKVGSHKLAVVAKTWLGEPSQCSTEILLSEAGELDSSKLENSSLEKDLFITYSMGYVRIQ